MKQPFANATIFLLVVLHSASLIICNSISAEIEQFSSEALTAHNQYRQQHGVPPLILNRQLADLAQQTAEKSATSNRLIQERPPYRGSKTGGMYASIDGFSTYTGKQVSDLWYRSTTSEGRPTKNQLIWKNTQMVGFGGAVSPSSGKVYIVAYYYPAGNVIGQEQENVFPIGGSSRPPAPNQNDTPFRPSFSFTTASPNANRRPIRPPQPPPRYQSDRPTFTFTTAPTFQSNSRPINRPPSPTFNYANARPGFQTNTRIPNVPAGSYAQNAPNNVNVIPSGNQIINSLIQNLQNYKTSHNW